MIPDPLKSTVKIPIKIINGYPCLDPQGHLPVLKEGTHADLIVPAFAFVNPNDAKQFTEENRKVILQSGTTLAAHVSEASIPNDLRNSVTHLNFGAAVEFQLMQDQYLFTRGTKNAELGPCKCFIPALRKNAKSINHAYTLISEEFEPNRDAHTGNVFSKVYFEKSNGWHKLKVLRGY